MKKIYALIMALAVALSASAITPTAFPSKKINQKVIERLSNPQASKLKIKTSAPKSRSGEFQLSDFTGSWYWMALDLATDDILDMTVTVSIADEATNTLRLENFFEEGVSGYATVDLETGNISIPYAIIIPDFDEGMDLAFATFGYEFSDEGDLAAIYPVKDPLVLTYNEEEEYYENPDAIYGVVAVYDGEPSTDFSDWLIWLGQAYVEILPPDAPDIIENDADYESAGYAVLQDGWIYPRYGFDQTLYPHVVPLEKSIVEKGVYRLVDPFAKSGDHNIAQIHNDSEEKGYVKFNIADTRIPYIYTNIYSGYTDKNIGRCYFTDKNGYYICEKGYRPDPYLFASQFKAKTISTFDEETQTMHIPCALFSVAGNKSSYMSWVDEDGEPIDMTSFIKLLSADSHVGNISTNDSNSPVHFFNLQGVKVDNPSHGIYIMCQGSKATKVIL